MDIYEYLKKDHRKVSALFSQYEKAIRPERKSEILAMIIEELTLHMISEQKTFYTAIAQLREAEDDINHAEEEHEDILEKMHEVANIQLGDHTLDNKVLELKKTVEHHVKEEENKIFKDAKKIFSKEEALVLKEKMHDIKEKILHHDIDIKLALKSLT